MGVTEREEGYRLIWGEAGHGMSQGPWKGSARSPRPLPASPTARGHPATHSGDPSCQPQHGVGRPVMVTASRPCHVHRKPVKPFPAKLQHLLEGAHVPSAETKPQIQGRPRQADRAVATKSPKL